MFTRFRSRGEVQCTAGNFPLRALYNSLAAKLILASNIQSTAERAKLGTQEEAENLIAL